jgi:glycosyltransferase involved in cell wall biosynthesis
MENLTRNWLRYVHNGCHLTLAPSQHTIDELTGHGFKRLRKWGRGVNSDRFDPRHATQEWREKLLNGRDPDSLLCIYVGRLATEKRVEQLTRVARTPGVALTIIGDGAEREHYENVFAGTDTHFTGYLFGNDLPAAFASADCFVFTGPNETFGQVIQEAMASGLPVVATNQGGVKDLILEGETGFVVEPTTWAFAQAVTRLRDDPDLRHAMSVRARRIAESRPWESVLGELEDHYTEAVNLNERFKRIFGGTNYHTPLRIPRELIG